MPLFDIRSRQVGTSKTRHSPFPDDSAALPDYPLALIKTGQSMDILVPNENGRGERRVALVPATIKKLAALKANLKDLE